MDLASLLQAPGPLTAKGDAGRPLIVAGSYQYHGAAVLCATAALRAGADYAYVLTHGGQKQVISAYSPNIICMEYGDSISQNGGEPSRPAFPQEGLLDRAAERTAGGLYGKEDACSASPRGDRIPLDWRHLRLSSIVVGPGLGRTEAALSLFRDVMRLAVSAGRRLPVVVDADGLWCLSRLWGAEREGVAAFFRASTVILTPNSREFSVLCSEILGVEGNASSACFQAATVEGTRILVPEASVSELRRAVSRLASELGCIVLLKGPLDVIEGPGAVSIEISSAGGDGTAGALLSGTPGRALGSLSGEPAEHSVCGLREASGSSEPHGTRGVCAGSSLHASSVCGSDPTAIYGQPKRCCGQGDVLAGTLGALTSLYALEHGELLIADAAALARAASATVKLAARKAYRAKGPGLCASDLIEYLPGVLVEVFPGLQAPEYSLDVC